MKLHADDNEDKGNDEDDEDDKMDFVAGQEVVAAVPELEMTKHCACSGFYNGAILPI